MLPNAAVSLGLLVSLLPVSLAPPPGAQRRQALPLQLRSPECLSLLLRGRAGADIRVPLPLVVLLGWWEPLLWWWVEDQRCGCLCGWREGVTGSSVTDAHLPVSVSTAAAGSPKAYGHLFCRYHVLWGCRLNQSGWGPGVGAPPALWSWSCVPAHLPLDIRIYGFSGILSALGRAALLSCGCLTGC